MWSSLSDPSHAEDFADFVEDIAPMCQLVGQLAGRPYASEVFAFTSLATFVLTTAPTYAGSQGHDYVAVAYEGRGLFAVEYAEWVSPTRNPQRRVEARRTCEGSEVIEVVDRYALRLLLARRGRGDAGAPAGGIPDDGRGS